MERGCSPAFGQGKSERAERERGHFQEVEPKKSDKATAESCDVSMAKPVPSQSALVLDSAQLNHIERHAFTFASGSAEEVEKKSRAKISNFPKSSVSHENTNLC